MILETRANLESLNSSKNLFGSLKIIRLSVKMFTEPLTRTPRYVLIKSLFLAFGWSYLRNLSPTFLKGLKLL